MKFDLHHEDTYSVIAIKESNLNNMIAPDIKHQFILQANADSQNALIIDLSEIEYADSSGLGALLLAFRLYRDNGRTLIFCGIRERVQKLIEISRLENVFKLAADQQAAISMLGAAKTDDSAEESA